MMYRIEATTGPDTCTEDDGSVVSEPTVHCEGCVCKFVPLTPFEEQLYNDAEDYRTAYVKANREAEDARTAALKLRADLRDAKTRQDAAEQEIAALQRAITKRQAISVRDPGSPARVRETGHTVTVVHSVIAVDGVYCRIRWWDDLTLRTEYIPDAELEDVDTLMVPE